MPVALLVALASLLWLAWVLGSRWLAAPRLRGDDLAASALYRLVQLYVRLVHGLRVEGREHVEALGEGDRPLIIMANHTAGIDPLLIQAALPFEVRWMMAQDMRVGAFEAFWSYARIIFVDRAEGDSGALREALRHLKGGGVLGLFPEGHIERPPGRLLPFQGGLGVLVARTGATVLPVVIDGTPRVDPAWASFARFSRSRVRFLPARRFEARRADPAAVTADLRRAVQQATGWPEAEWVPEWSEGRWWYVDREGRRVAAEEVESRR